MPPGLPASSHPPTRGAHFFNRSSLSPWTQEILWKSCSRQVGLNTAQSMIKMDQTFNFQMVTTSATTQMIPKFLISKLSPLYTSKCLLSLRIFFFPLLKSFLCSLLQKRKKKRKKKKASKRHLKIMLSRFVVHLLWFKKL